MPLDDELRYRIVTLLQEAPNVSQRELSSRLNISLGKVNYCINALIDKGWVKIENFRNNKNKKGYAYILTPQGITQKARITRGFLKRKLEEYENLEKEIEQLRKEISVMD